MNTAFIQITRCVPLLLMLLASGLASAEIPTRPKIGLVLSGGGARGAAHIGVLKQLEALNIPVDFIAGTSIGSVIGGLYAIGNTAAEIEVLISEIEWDVAFSDSTNRASLPIRQKFDETDFLINFELGIDKQGVSVPKGVLQGQKLRLILNDILSNVALIDDFDDFPIPFRAIASDIEHGSTVVLGKGDIVTAVQASMAVPGVFAPVEVDGTMLVDGGVTNNLPVDVVRSMGADIVIAVDISSPLTTRKNLHSAIEILDQLAKILNQGNVEERIQGLTEQDFLIQPDLTKISSADFNLTSEGVREGEKAVQPYVEPLKRLAMAPSDYAAHRDRIVSHSVIKKTITPDYISVRQNSRLSSVALRTRLKTQPAVPLDRKRLHKDIGRMYGLGFFQTVSYGLKEDQGLVGLVIDAKEKDWGPNYLRFGLQLEDDLEGNNDYNLLIGLTRKPINALGGEISAVLKVGDEPIVDARYYQPFNGLAQSYGLLSLDSSKRIVNIYDGGLKLASYDVEEVEVAAFAGVQYSNFVDIRLGLKRSHGEATLKVGDELFVNEVSFENGSAILEFRYDTLNSLSFPKSGFRGSFSYEHNAESLGAETDYTTFAWKGAFVHSFGAYRTALNSDIALTVEGVAPLEALHNIGGFRNLSGYGKNEFSNQHKGLLGIAVYRPILESDLKQFDQPLHIGASIEAGNVWQYKSEIERSNLLYSASVFVGTETALGPVYFGYGQAEDGQGSMYFSLGHVF